MFKDHDSLVKFLQAHRRLEFREICLSSFIRLPKLEKATLILQRLPAISNCDFQEIIFDYVAKRAERPVAMISTIFESKNAGNISANVQFCFEHDAEAAYKYLLDD